MISLRSLPDLPFFLPVLPWQSPSLSLEHCLFFSHILLYSHLEMFLKLGQLEKSSGGGHCRGAGTCKRTVRVCSHPADLLLCKECPTVGSTRLPCWCSATPEPFSDLSPLQSEFRFWGFTCSHSSELQQGSSAQGDHNLAQDWRCEPISAHTRLCSTTPAQHM